MAKKKLSSRELAAKKAGGSLNYKTGKVSVAPKVTSRAVAKSPLVGAGPLMTGQARVGGTVQGAGPLLPGQTRDNSYKGGSSRDMAAKAQKTKLNPASSVKAAEASGLLGTQSKVPNQPTIKGGGGGGLLQTLKNKGMGILSNIGQASYDSGAGIAGASGRRTQEELMNNRRTLADNSFGIPTTNAMTEKDLPSNVNPDDYANMFPTKRDGINPTSIGEDGTQYYNGFGPQDQSLQSKFISSQKSNQVAQNNPLFGIPTANASSGSEYADGRNTFKQKQDNWKNPWGDVDISGESQPEPSYQQVQNDVYGNNEQAPYDQAPEQVTRQVRGSGLFGTGKGVGNPAGGNDDPYIKELRKAYSSNGGEKWLRKQFEELIAALDPTYAQMQKEGTDALNAQLNNQNIQLASVMNANNTGDSEQRAQLMAGQQRDSQTALGNLLAKLSQNKAQDVSGYKGQMAEAMSKYKQNEQQDARTLLEKLQVYKGQKAQGAGTGAARVAPQMTGKTSRNEVFNWVEDALGKGYSWEEISQNAQEQGIGTETDGYLDQLLRNANKQNRFAR